MELPSVLLDPSSKTDKNPPRKIFCIFQEMELCDSKIKKFLIFSEKKAFLIFLDMEPCTSQAKLEKITKIDPKKISNVLGNWNFLALILNFF